MRRNQQRQVVTKTTTSTSTKKPKTQLSEEDMEKIKEAFDLFDFEGKGRIDPSFVRETMDKLNYEEKNPVVYKIIVQLDTPENSKNGGVNYKEFVESKSSTFKFVGMLLLKQLYILIKFTPV